MKSEIFIKKYIVLNLYRILYGMKNWTWYIKLENYKGNTYDNTRLFTSREYDKESGLYYYRNADTTVQNLEDLSQEILYDKQMMWICMGMRSETKSR